MQTLGNGVSRISPFSDRQRHGWPPARHVAVNNFNLLGNYTGTNTTDLTMSAIAADAFIPIVPVSKDHKGNSLSVDGEFSSGYGDADQFIGLTGGIKRF